jgi:hypothetical protein
MGQGGGWIHRQPQPRPGAALPCRSPSPGSVSCFALPAWHTLQPPFTRLSLSACPPLSTPTPPVPAAASWRGCPAGCCHPTPAWTWWCSSPPQTAGSSRSASTLRWGRQNEMPTGGLMCAVAAMYTHPSEQGAPLLGSSARRGSWDGMCGACGQATFGGRLWGTVMRERHGRLWVRCRWSWGTRCRRWSRWACVTTPASSQSQSGWCGSGGRHHARREGGHCTPVRWQWPKSAVGQAVALR